LFIKTLIHDTVYGIILLGGERVASVDKDVKHYMSLPYTTIIEPMNDESGFYYVGRIMEFEGCIADGDTKIEALQSLQEAMEIWIETKLANGFHVPEPIRETKLTGKFTLRLPKTLHQRLTTEAVKEGVSLNQYALYKLSQ